MTISGTVQAFIDGWVMVTDHMSATTDKDGRFTLMGLLPGKHELEIWSREQGRQRVQIQVPRFRTKSSLLKSHSLHNNRMNDEPEMP